ncbi:unnamed protein product [Rotaria magnacalcarata]
MLCRNQDELIECRRSAEINMIVFPCIHSPSPAMDTELLSFILRVRYIDDDDLFLQVVDHVHYQNSLVFDD